MTTAIRCTVLALAAGSAAAQSSTATYELTFQATWSQPTHPNAFIAAAHFSPLIGGLHNAQVEFWAPGTLATRGIEVMAETGLFTPLRSEVNAAIVAGTATAVVQGISINSPDTTSLTFQADSTHDRLTLVTMVAPSPDWFIGVHGLPLRDAQGQWIAQLDAQLEVYDAGTDSGASFDAPDADTDPADPIRNIQTEPPFLAAPTLGVFSIRLVSVDVCFADVNADGDLQPSDFKAWIDAFNALDPAADQNRDGQVQPNDFAAWIRNYNEGC
jgi:hypothetical protein